MGGVKEKFNQNKQEDLKNLVNFMENNTVVGNTAPQIPPFDFEGLPYEIKEKPKPTLKLNRDESADLSAFASDESIQGSSIYEKMDQFIKLEARLNC